jgi:hypothetical protein
LGIFVSFESRSVVYVLLLVAAGRPYEPAHGDAVLRDEGWAVGKRNLPMALSIGKKSWVFSMAFFVLVDPTTAENCYAIRTYLKNEVRVQGKARNSEKAEHTIVCEHFEPFRNTAMGT